LNFSDFAADGEDIPSAAYHAYDATLAYAYGLHSLAYTHKKENINGEALRKEILDNVDFHGATGHVGFSKTYINDGFDVGSRNVGMRFAVTNYDKRFGTEEFVAVGDYHTATGVTFFGAVMFADGGSVLPPDRPLPRTDDIAPWMLTASMAFSICAMTLVVFTAAMIYAYSFTRLVKAAQPPVIYVILFGLLLGSIRGITGLLRPSSGLCVAQMWLGHLAFTLVFAALLVKSWKVYKVINAGMRKFVLSTAGTLRIIGYSCVPVILFLTFITSLGKTNTVFILVFEDQFDIIYQERCEIELSQELKGLYVLELLALVYGMWLCYLIKDVPDSISNSGVIAHSKYDVWY
jgi:hypothetical protein